MISIWDKDRIRKAREDAKLLVKDAAIQMEITPEYLSMIENGHKQPSQKLIGKMSALYDKTADYFLKNEKNLVSV